jgi:hypothetical protein
VGASRRAASAGRAVGCTVPEHPGEFMTVAEVAAILKLDQQTVQIMDRQRSTARCAARRTTRSNQAVRLRAAD